MVDIKPLNPIEPTGVPGVPDEPRVVAAQPPAAQAGTAPVPSQSPVAATQAPEPAPAHQPNQSIAPGTQAAQPHPAQPQPAQPTPQALAGSIYPAATTGSEEPVTPPSSPIQFHPGDTAHPAGVYVIAGLSILGSLYYLYVSSSSAGDIVWFKGLTLTIIYVVIGLNIALNIGLIMLKEIARKIFIALAIVSIFYTAYGAVRVLNAKGEVDKYKNQFQSQIDSSRSRSASKERINQIQTQYDDAFGRVQGLLTRALVVQLVSIGVTVVQIYYLCLPRVRNAFS